MRLYRVFPYLRSAEAGAPGHPLYLPPCGGGRLDNPTLYTVLYASDSQVGAVAETFGRRAEWSKDMLSGIHSVRGSRRALVEFDVEDDADVCNLDSAAKLVELALRPSDVVTRNRRITQAWAHAIFSMKRYIGARWWSYYNPRFSSYGIWNIERLRVQSVELLKLDSSSVQDAATALCRIIKR